MDYALITEKTQKSVGYWFTIHKDMFSHEFFARINILCSEDLCPGRIGPYVPSAPEVQKQDYFLYGCELYTFFIKQTFYRSEMFEIRKHLGHFACYPGIIFIKYFWKVCTNAGIILIRCVLPICLIFCT